ncbi:Clp protease N-terminal domain-containing protein [Streptomyces sp. NPDC053755]|uniref:Clp protease N-terminal domain-containing protein n=1 Tax=Streptomyces sp. NPDC053755 TaxID=3155815 RepID=UPI00344106B2
MGLGSVLTVELATVVAGARRRALRGGDRQIDTAHLLHSLIESDPEVGAAFDGPPQLARVLGYLVQRSIGYGARWRRSVEETGAGHVVRRDAADASGATALTPAMAGSAATEWPGAAKPDGVAAWSGVAGWSPSAAAAMASAFERAARRGEPRARGLDLLAAVAADQESRAAEVLRRARVDARALTARIGELSQQV